MEIIEDLKTSSDHSDIILSAVLSTIGYNLPTGGKVKV